MVLSKNEKILKILWRIPTDPLSALVRPNKFLDAAFRRFDGGNKQKEVRVKTSTVKGEYFWDQGN